MKTNESENCNEKEKLLEATAQTELPSEMTEMNSGKESPPPKKKPVPKWKGESTKVKYEGRTEISKSELPFFIVFGSTILKRDFFFFGLIALTIILMITVPTVYWILDERTTRITAYEADISGQANRADTTQFRPMPNQLNIYNLMQWHIAQSHIDQLKSYQITGIATMANDQSETQIAFLGLPPNDYRQDSWTQWNYRVSSRMQSGETSHIVSSDAISLHMNHLEEAILWIESSFGYLAQTFLAEQKATSENQFNYSKLRFTKITDMENRRFAIVESETPRGFKMLHYIDYETGLESRRTALVQNENDIHEVEVLYFYEDMSKKIERTKPTLPFSYLLKVDGVPKYSVNLENAQINSGLTESLFSENPVNRYSNETVVK